MAPLHGGTASGLNIITDPHRPVRNADCACVENDIESKTKCTAIEFADTQSTKLRFYSKLIEIQNNLA